MRVLVEAEYETGDINEESGDPVMKKEKLFLLHWGTDFDIIELSDKNRIGVSYTVGICEDPKTGNIRCFRPQQIRIIGQDITSLKK